MATSVAELDQELEQAATKSRRKPHAAKVEAAGEESDARTRRHMCKLPTVQIIRKGDKIPFDVSQGRTIRIDMSDVYWVIESVDSAKRELKQHLRHALSDDYKGEDNPVNTYLPGLEVKLPK